MTLRTERIRTLDQIRAFLDGSEPADFRFAGRDSAYDARGLRGAPQAAAGRQARLSARRHRPPRRSGWRKGACVINVVDEVTHFQHLGAVPRITQHFMVPVLKDLISAFPFTVKAFHADSGSEYINREVADLLDRLHIPTFTTSRPRRSNDNALVESKNGSIVRRWPGHIRVSHDLVPQLDAFLRDSLCPLLNFHRPCVTFKALGQLASTTTGLDAAKAVQRARDALFRAIGKARDSAA